MRVLVFTFLFTLLLNAKTTITPNEVYAQTVLIAQHTEFLLDFLHNPSFNIKTSIKINKSTDKIKS